MEERLGERKKREDEMNFVLFLNLFTLVIFMKVDNISC